MESSNSETIELDITVNKQDLNSGVWQVISRLKPQWSEDKIEYKMFSDGITNKLVGVIHDGDKINMILVRVFGENTEKFIDRQAEVKNIKVLHSLGFGPTLYACFSNGLAYQYLPGETLNVETCIDSNIYPLVAEKMAQFHRQLENMHSKVLNAGENHSAIQSVLWAKLKGFIELLPEVCSSNALPKEKLKEELDWLEEKLTKLNNPIVFCHNDLLLGNILHEKNSHSIEFIDFEYAGPNYQAYDIANHFCEFAGVDNFDPSRYPSEKLREEWVTAYLRSFHESQHVDKGEVQLLVEHIELFTLASHFFWGVWALIQAAHSTIDFDFLGYSNLRLAEFKKRKVLLTRSNL